MRTAVDTNILVDIFGRDRTFLSGSVDALRKCISEGVVVACEVVWAEAAAVFSDLERFREVMADLPASFSPMTEAAATGAAQAWRLYRQAGGPRSRIAADFLIGAHALVTADRLLTRDVGFYRNYFKGLRVLDPTA